jgi:poly(A)-specific ribonuclease
MNIDQRNFVKNLPRIKKSIETADFISVDTELTGLTVRPTDMIDSLEERYSNLKDTVNQYLIIQFGICCFHKTKKGYVAEPFNFYLFPGYPSKILHLERTFTISTSSIRFLSQYGFDFNTCMHYGLSYLNRDQEEQGKKRIEAYLEMQDADIPIPDTQAVFVEKVAKQVEDWLKESQEKTFLVETASGLQRKLVHQHIRKTYNGFFSTQGQSNCVELKRLTSEEREAWLKTRNSGVVVTLHDPVTLFSKI